MSAACERVAASLVEIPEAMMAAHEAAGEHSYLVNPAKVVADPYALVAKAGLGDIEAQRNAADMALLHALYGGDPDPLGTLSDGLMFARMAASRGDTADLHRMVYMLGVAGTVAVLPSDKANFAAELLAVLELLADRGDEQCATLLASAADNETAETMETAKDIKARLVEHWGLN